MGTAARPGIANRGGSGTALAEQARSGTREKGTVPSGSSGTVPFSLLLRRVEGMGGDGRCHGGEWYLQGPIPVSRRRSGLFLRGGATNSTVVLAVPLQRIVAAPELPTRRHPTPPLLRQRTST